MSCTPSPSVVSCHDDHIRDLCQLVESLTVSGSSLDTISWKRKTVEESITLSKASHTNSLHVNQTIPNSDLSTSSHAQDHLPPSSSSSHAQHSTNVALLPMQVPKPSDITPPHAGLEPEGFWLITVGQEVGIFYHWADVAERTNFVSGNVQKRYPLIPEGTRVPTPGGPFWLPASPPSPSWSADSDDLWSQVDDLSETMTHYEL
ncbi:hypothetical protein DFJ58DRAFT_726482 [Suillus subalutaceus]|uniref:uncharacterized protein n=1 Tax=Suillus subalutaceus TaxID=48586 RepID=UPI001B85B39F|nr:uncharacterized protein DFJ58DRAFT_726482 [Suillus subalutaceus]KAG1859025.1 hypothetical protein DFJ58DRAFT_726482 [Suillus subalutaceus]